MRLEQSTAPVLEPVTYAEMRSYLRLHDDNEQALVEDLITVARDYAEIETGRQLITATWKLYLKQFPAQIRVPRPPLQSVTSIGYVDQAGAAQTVTATVYYVDTKAAPGLIYEDESQLWPTHRGEPGDFITVTYKAGYGLTPSTVPEGIRLAIRYLVAHWFDTRQPIVIGSTVTDIPITVERLLTHYKVGWEW